MGLFLFFLLFFSVQANVVSLPSNTTSQSTGFRIEGGTLTGQKLIPLESSITTAQLKVLYAPPLFIGALLTSSVL